MENEIEFLKSEKNNDKFIVERSIDGITYQAIAEVKSKNEFANAYNYTDANINELNAEVIYYQLKQVDFSGAYSYSPIKALVMKNNSNPFVLENFYPNPFTEMVNLKINVEQSSALNYQLFDTKGALIISKTIQVEKGANTLSINGLNDLPAGIYLLKMDNGTNHYNTKLQKE